MGAIAAVNRLTLCKGILGRLKMVVKNLRLFFVVVICLPLLYGHATPVLEFGLVYQVDGARPHLTFK